MRKNTLFLALALLLVSAAAYAAGLKFVARVKVDNRANGTAYALLSPDTHAAVAYQKLDGIYGDGSDFAADFNVLSINGAKTEKLRIGFGEFLSSSPDAFIDGDPLSPVASQPSRKYVRAVPRLVYYNPAKSRAGVILSDMKLGDGATRNRFIYVHYDLSSGTALWHCVLADFSYGKGGHALVSAISVDADEKSLYYYSQEKGDGGSTWKIARLDFDTRKTADEYEVVTTGDSASLFHSPDMKFFLLAEYWDQGDKPDHEPQCHVIDFAVKRHRTFKSPPTLYGAAFAGKYLYYGSNQLGKVWRYDLEKGKADLEASCMKRMQAFYVSPDKKTLYIFAAGQVIEQRELPTLKLVKKIASKTVFGGEPEYNGEGGVQTLGGGFIVTPESDSASYKGDSVFILSVE